MGEGVQTSGEQVGGDLYQRRLAWQKWLKGSKRFRL